ncbi:MAG: hypothetical protein RMJ33_01955 [Saprospiraceae bacterium]|nr:hypothetical protein [Saprospiraceae bacterium]MDW8228577.1 hypothetical protein [Saprospiraceae bacterium]
MEKAWFFYGAQDRANFKMGLPLQGFTANSHFLFKAATFLAAFITPFFRFFKMQAAGAPKRKRPALPPKRLAISA